VNCVTNDEGIPGNQVLSKDGKTLYIAHTSADSNKVSVSIGTLSGSGPTTTASWKTVQVNTDLCPDKKGMPGAGEQCGAALFATLAQDTAGNLYVVSASTSHKAGTQTSPYSVFLHHSTDGGKSWGTASKASTAGSNAFRGSPPVTRAGSTSPTTTRPRPARPASSASMTSSTARSPSRCRSR